MLLPDIQCLDKSKHATDRESFRICSSQPKVSMVRFRLLASHQSEGVGIPRTAYLIPGRRGMWGGRCRDVRRRFRRRRRFRFRFRRCSPGWVTAVGRATHPRPTLGPMGPMGPMDPI